MEKDIKYRLGLDVGASSLGWSVLELDSNDKPVKVIDAGSRIFSDGREDKSKSTLKADRRDARSARRRLDRYKQRRTFLLSELIKIGLFPKNEEERKELQVLNPYELRARALKEKLDPYEIGRALFHINQRRGFKSNRKDKSEENVSGTINSSIEILYKKMGLMQGRCNDEEYKALPSKKKKEVRQKAAKDKENALTKLVSDQNLTFGTFLWDRYKDKKLVRARKNIDKKFYEIYPVRELLEDEFNKICKTQSKYHSKLLTEKNIKRLHYIIFWQRPLKPQAIGQCSYISGEKRAFKAMPSFQRYRIYQDINSLEWISISDGSKYRLRDYPDARDVIIEMLEKPTVKIGNVTFKNIRKQIQKIGIDESKFTFNYETLNRKGFDGNLTSNLMQREECVGPEWHKWSLDKQDQFIAIILNDDFTDEEALDLLIKDYGLSKENTRECLNAHLPEGTANLSMKAAHLLLEKMKSDYCLQSEAVQQVAKKVKGFLNPFTRASEGELVGKLPFYGKWFSETGRHIIPGSNNPNDKHDDLKYFGGVTNPTVHISLNQIRNVVNELIGYYGRPCSIAIELGRELPLGKKKLDEIKSENKKHQDLNEKIDDELKENGVLINRENRIRLKLWYRLDQNDISGRKCPFTGEGIGIADLFNGNAQIEHLIPFSYSLDDSMANKVICTRKANVDKGNQTPFEAFGKNPSGYNWLDILKRASKLPDATQWRFNEDAKEKWKNDNKDFLARHLNDTRYIGRLAKEYLEAICPHNKIDVLTGRLTALLRKHWGLNSILTPTNSQLKEADNKSFKKNREDHRHHAVDAIVIGMTTRSILQKVHTQARKAEKEYPDALLPKLKNRKSAIDPWNGFRDDVIEIVDKIIVSHKPKRKKLFKKVNGKIYKSTSSQLHNDTAYGIISFNDAKPSEVVVRKPIEAFIKKPESLGCIRDVALRKEFEDAYAKDIENGIRGLAGERDIKNVRCVEKLSVIPIKDKEGNVYKAFKGDSNWGCEIYEYPEGHPKAGKWEGVIISTFQANQASFQPGTTSRPHPSARLVMRLQINDYVQIEKEAKNSIVRVVKLSKNGICFANPNEANVDARNRDKNDPFKYLSKNIQPLQKLNARKLHISPAGRISSIEY